jgi:hypothetical protein
MRPEAGDAPPLRSLPRHNTHGRNACRSEAARRSPGTIPGENGRFKTTDTTSTATTTHGRTVRERATARPTSWHRFVRHYVAMVLAMYAGMLALDPVYAAVAARAG